MASSEPSIRLRSTASSASSNTWNTSSPATRSGTSTWSRCSRLSTVCGAMTFWPVMRVISISAAATSGGQAGQS